MNHESVWDKKMMLELQLGSGSNQQLSTVINDMELHVEGKQVINAPVNAHVYTEILGLTLILLDKSIFVIFQNDNAFQESKEPQNL